MKTMTEQLAADLPLAAIPVSTEVATLSGGKIGVADKHSAKNADIPRDPNTAINEDQHELLADVYEIWKQVELQGGVVPATLLNMHPWAIKSSGPHNEGITVPACPPRDEFVQFVQRSPRFDFGDRWGKFKVRPVWPVQIMNDFKRQHFAWGGGERPWGGIVVYMGDHLPGTSKQKVGGLFDKLQSIVARLGDSQAKAALEEALEEQRKEVTAINESRLSDAEIIRLVASARELQLRAYEESYDKAIQSMASFTANQKGAGYPITNYQILISQWLFHRGHIAKLPPWVTEKRPRGFKQNLCKKCGVEISESGYACGKCGRIDKPYAAFLDGAVPKDDPAMKRCTRAELDSLGLTDILTLEEELAVDTKPKAEKKKKAE